MRNLEYRWLIGALLATLASCVWAQAGRVQVVVGDVQIIAPDKTARPAVRGDAVNEGDTIQTGRNGAVHLRMADDGIVAMRADSAITIDTFRWSGKEDGTESSVLGLLKGGFRAITGIIGRTNRSQYLVRTTTATIGIRGTDHEPFYIPPPEPGETPSAAPGTYNKVNVGETFIRSAAGTIELSANQVGFASIQPDAAPVRLERVPSFMRPTPLPRGRADPRPMRETAARDPRRGELVRALQNRPVQTLRQLPGLLTRTAQEDFDLGGQQGGFARAPNGTGLGASMVFRDAGEYELATGSLFVTGNNQNSILENANRVPLIISDQSGFRYSRQNAPILDRGSAVVDDAAVNWGVYGNGGLRFDERRGITRVPFFTFMQTNTATSAAILQTPGAAVFNNTLGFTQPVDENSNVGGAARLRVAIAFGATPMVNAYDLAVLDGSRRLWGATLNQPQTLQSFARAQATPNLTVRCIGACAANGRGEASGFVIGSNRAAVISSYALTTPGAAVLGSILVGR